jgi:hypothetical protein
VIQTILAVRCARIARWMMSDPNEKLLDFIRKHGKDYAQACADVEYLREYRKSKKAILEIEAAELHGLKTGQEREAYAYAHPDYIALLDGLRVAVDKEKYLGIMINKNKDKEIKKQHSW